jgi:hypothetical protein
MVHYLNRVTYIYCKFITFEFGIVVNTILYFECGIVVNTILYSFSHSLLSHSFLLQALCELLVVNLFVKVSSKLHKSHFKTFLLG